jgi:hypothetical protein
MSASLLPQRGRGRPTPAAEADYRERVAAFCDLIQEIRSTMDFAVGSRGWCYILEDLSGAVGWSPDNLVITRFGLNADFIDEHGLTWIDNLETSSGGQLDDPNHNDHDKSYVQDYIAEFGVRKCEANALVVEPEVGRALCHAAILAHVPISAPERYQRKLVRVRKRLQQALRERVA